MVDLNFEKSQSIWTEWPIEMHNSQPQLERQERACNPYYSPLSLSPDRGSAIFLSNYGKYNTTPYDKLKFDLMYIRKYSVLLDLKLIIMTPKILFLKECTEGVEK